jgi:hypothetical protein
MIETLLSAANNTCTTVAIPGCPGIPVFLLKYLLLAGISFKTG